MRYWIFIFMALSMSGCSTTPEPQFKDFGPAPELENEIWLNTETPLRIEELRGSVVIIEMWTYG